MSMQVQNLIDTSIKLEDCTYRVVYDPTEKFSHGSWICAECQIYFTEDNNAFHRKDCFVKGLYNAEMILVLGPNTKSSFSLGVKLEIEKIQKITQKLKLEQRSRVKEEEKSSSKVSTPKKSIPQTVVLKDGQVVSLEICKLTMKRICALKELASESRALFQFMKKCNDPSHPFEAAPWGGFMGTLKMSGLLNEKGKVDEDVRKVALNALEMNGYFSKIIDPRKFTNLASTFSPNQ